jgi:hypothetical protein
MAQWTVEDAAAWAERTGWLVGANFVPSTAVNQLEMWQPETFDPETIDRELGWAAAIGMNSMRVFLHDLLWRDDAPGLLGRMEEYLAIAAGHGIGTLFVLFDSVWNPEPASGPQPEPRPRTHNSGWVQGPGAKLLAEGPAAWGRLEDYVAGVIGHFRDDPRVHGWDLINEPDNPNRPLFEDREVPRKWERAHELLEMAFTQGRQIRPSQPLTTGVWTGGDWSDEAALRPLWRYSLEASDVISFHDYSPLPQLRARADSLRRYGRPILCTEYMARGRGSTFDPNLGYLREQGIGAYNWGLVDGRSQTKFHWASWAKEFPEEPDPWFHDIFRRDGTPYDPGEVAYIRRMTGGA